MTSIKEKYVKTLQDFQDRPLIKASLWTFRTIRDLRSVTKKSNVLTCSDRIVILLRGIAAILIWLPVNLIAIPYTFMLCALHKKIVPTPQLHEIIPGLYLGTDQAAECVNTLKKHGITSVLSVIDFKVNVPTEQVSDQEHVSIEDYPHVDISPAINQAIKFVEKARKENRKVLVHCNMGKSRSASVMVGLVQNINQVDSRAALNLVRKKRSVVDINYGFKKQLQRTPVKTYPIPQQEDSI